MQFFILHCTEATMAECKEVILCVLISRCEGCCEYRRIWQSGSEDGCHLSCIVRALAMVYM